MIATPSRLAGTELDIYPINALPKNSHADPSSLPMTVKVLLEGLLRLSETGSADDRSVSALAAWPAPPPTDAQLPFLPARVLMQDFTGVPAVVDLAAMRSAMRRAGKDAGKVDPLVPVDLIIDHSVQVDAFGFRDAYTRNIEKEIERNRERYSLLRWAQQAFHNFSLVPPGMGICHQVNLEYIAKVVQVRDIRGRKVAIPDTLMGTDSHTTMVNGLGVLGWGVGGIEAEQHVPRVRGHVGALPGRRADPPLHGGHRAQPRADRPGRAIHERAGPVSGRRRRSAEVLRAPRARPDQGRAQPGGPEAAAGPGVASQRMGQLCRRLRQWAAARPGGSFEDLR